MNFLKRIGGGLRLLGGLIFPMFARARDVLRLGPTLWWTLHLLLLAAGLCGLALLHRRLALDRFLAIPHPVFRNVWLPLLFLLAYALGWLGRWLWRLLGPGQESAVFPDIDRAWDEAVRALDQAGIDLTDVPLFLVLGRPQGAEEGLFQGGQLRLLVEQAPRRADAPLHVYANRDAIYVTCAGASLLGRQAPLLAAEGEEAAAPPPPAVVSPDRGEDLSTIGAAGDESSRAMEEMIARLRQQGRGMGQPLEEEQRALGLLVVGRAGAGTQAPRAARTSLLRNRAEVELQAARLEHLCRRIARDRRPYCPVNGILLLVPLAATDNDGLATDLGVICRRDLATARETLKVLCPIFALVCDLETLPGFRELIGRLPEAQRQRRLGQRFPLVPDVEPAAVPPMIDSGVQWIGRKPLPDLVDNLWRIEPEDRQPPGDVVRGNIRLYHLLRQFRERLKRLSRVLVRASAAEDGPPAMLGGCYLAGTGPDSAREQAFLPGVFRRLIESQDYVSWTPDALAEEAAYLRWTRYGYLGLGLVTAACAALAVYVLVQRPGH